jgi:hypothetical protein
MTTLAAPLSLVPLQVPGLTLGERLDQAWSELQGQGTAACPVCDERMELDREAGRCGGCGSELR